MPDPVQVDDRLARAGEALLREDWRTATELLEEAHVEAPHDAAVLADLAFVLLQCGRAKEAWPLFVEARGLGVDDAETLLQGAQAALACSRPAESEEWALAALDRDPTLAVDLTEDRFAGLRGRPVLEDALAHAWERVHAPRLFDG